MPTVKLELNDTDLSILQKAYQAATGAPSQTDDAARPSFEQWLGSMVVSGRSAERNQPNADIVSMQLFGVIERLVTSLHGHGFELAHTAKPTDSVARSTVDLAKLMVTDFTLAPQYQHRIQQLFEHYLKSANDIANDSHVGVTKRAYGALHEAFRQLCERTVDSVDHLGESRAVGRVEGASAVLVSVGVMDRPMAQSKVKLFKEHVSAPKRNKRPRIR